MALAEAAEVNSNSATSFEVTCQTLSTEINIATSSSYEQSTLSTDINRATSSLYGQSFGQETNAEQYEDGYAVILDSTMNANNEIQPESSSSWPTMQPTATDYNDVFPNTEAERGRPLT